MYLCLIMEEKSTLQESLDRFEQTLEAGLVKVCNSAGLVKDLMRCPDVDAKWDDYIKDYVADAVENYNGYPDAALGFAAFLGMAVAYNWDVCWEVGKRLPYKAYYGDRGFDNMDDHIVQDLLKLSPEQARRICSTLNSCTSATIGLIRHEGIEAQTAMGFYTMVRSCSVLYRIGAAIEFELLGYKKQYIK